MCIYIYIEFFFSVYCEQSESTVILTTCDELTCTDGCALVYRLKVCSATATTSARFCPPFDSEMMPPKEKDALSPSTTACVSQLQDMQIPTNLDNHHFRGMFPISNSKRVQIDCILVANLQACACHHVNLPYKWKD